MNNIHVKIYVTKKMRTPPVNVVYGSSGVGIEIEIMDYDLPAGSTAETRATGKFATAVYKNPCTVDGNIITMYPETGFFVPGGNEFQVVITAAGKTILSFVMDVICDKDIGDGNDPAKPEQVLPFVQRAENAAAQSEAAAARAEEVKDSIPEDYTELSDGVNQLKDDLTNLTNTIVSDGIRKKIINLNAGSTNWHASTGYTALFDVSPNDEIVVTAQDSISAFVGMLSDDSNIVKSQPVHYCEGTGRVVINKGASETLVAPSDAKYFYCAMLVDGVEYTPKSVKIGNYDLLESVRWNIDKALVCDSELDVSSSNPVSNRAVARALDILEADISDLHGTITMKVATGTRREFAKFGASGTEYKAVSSAQKRNRKHRYYVAVNHDDIQRNDYVNTYKIYNKYDAHGNFNFILKPFESAEEMKEMVREVKQMVADGHDIGLHAILQESAWWVNKTFDVKPNFSTSYAPNLSEVKSDTGNGKNVFGYSVTETKTLREIGWSDCPVTTALGSITQSEYIIAVTYYTIAFSSQTYKGLDLDGVEREWTAIRWLEHWYNRLIDDTLGYSAYTGVDNFYKNGWSYPSDVTDKSGRTTYYPDVAHLSNGKIVRWDDTTNPNFSDTEYQKVGYCTTGLFKGACTTLNAEVRQRCIQIAKAFMRHYFGVDNFTNYGHHGVRYVRNQWFGQKNSADTTSLIRFDDRNNTIISDGYGRMFNTIKSKFETGYDILLEEGIKMVNHSFCMTNVLYGQKGLFIGQNGIRDDFFNYADVINYLDFAGSSPSFNGVSIDTDAMDAFLSNVDAIAFAYDNAGKSVTNGGVTMYVHPYIKEHIDAIKACIGTGKIPVMSDDTIVFDASHAYAVEAFAQFCDENDIGIITLEEARGIAVERSNVQRNYFPNPSFRNALSELHNVVSDDSTYPDGWTHSGVSGRCTVSGNELTIERNSTSGNCNSYTCAYGLPSGKYKISFEAKKNGGDSYFDFFVLKNSDYVGYDKLGTTGKRFDLTTEWAECAFEFIIPEYKKNQNTGSVENEILKGYEDNIMLVKLYSRISGTGEGLSISIRSPKIESVNN